MTKESLQEVLSWIKTTDLVEVSYKNGEQGFALASAQPQAQPSYPTLAGRFVPVVSPAVGLFQWNEPGRARKLEEGADMAEGDLIGVVETAKGKTTPVKAPRAGRVARVMIDAGSPVEYGQPLAFLEPRRVEA